MGYVKRELIEAGIARIEFFHEAQNSLPSSILSQLAEEISLAGKDSGTRVIVLQSGGNRTFCAGASFTELVAIRNREEGLAFFSGFAHVINALRTCGKIVIGRVQGKAIGGGVGLAAATDYCLATEHAAVRLSELAVGIGPFVVGPAVERKTGLSAFSQMTLNATELYPAGWACEKGLFAAVYETIEDLDAAVMELARKLVQSNPDALEGLKKIFWEGTDHWDRLLTERAAMSGTLVLSEFTRKTLERFQSEKNG